MKAYLASSFDPDGACYEGTMYGPFGLFRILPFSDCCARFGAGDAMADGFLDRVINQLTNELTPGRDRMLPINDTNGNYLPWGGTLFLYDASHYHNPLARWAWTDLEKRRAGHGGHTWAFALLWEDGLADGKPPDKLVAVTKGRGTLTVRTGWEKNDFLAAFECGRRVPGTHGQSDVGHFLIYAKGRCLAADTGYSNEAVEGSPQQSVGHNLVLVDGKGEVLTGNGQVTEGKLVQWEEKKTLVWAQADLAGAFAQKNYNPMAVAGRPVHPKVKRWLGLTVLGPRGVSETAADVKREIKGGKLLGHRDPGRGEGQAHGHGRAERRHRGVAGHPNRGWKDRRGGTEGEIEMAYDSRENSKHADANVRGRNRVGGHGSYDRPDAARRRACPGAGRLDEAGGRRGVAPSRSGRNRPTEHVSEQARRVAQGGGDHERRLAGNATGPCLQGQSAAGRSLLDPYPCRDRCQGHRGDAPGRRQDGVPAADDLGGRQPPDQRVVFVPWSEPGSCTQATGKFDFTGEEQQIRVWLPEGVRLDYLQISPYTPPKVPPAAAAYRPTIVPPASRPRLWVNQQSLPQVRANLDKGENAPLWTRVKRRAAKPFEFKVRPDTEVGYNAALESAAVAKAFVHLMTGDRARGREAVTLMRDYLAAVQFDNLLDITREIGRAIYSGALAYDWCYDVMTPEDRDSIRKSLMRLADDMEIGWPPFLQTIVNGHGNEAQLNRDLLSMAIAIYDEDPVPYRYCAYRILEELAPMRKFEYQSPRHNQGVSYGPYRFGWDLHAAWLLRRMTGKPVFDPNIGDVYKFWLYMRLPTGQMLRDGDGFSDGRQVNLGLTPLLGVRVHRRSDHQGRFPASERDGRRPDSDSAAERPGPGARAEPRIAAADPRLRPGPRVDGRPDRLESRPEQGRRGGRDEGRRLSLRQPPALRRGQLPDLLPRPAGGRPRAVPFLRHPVRYGLLQAFGLA